MRIKPFLFGVRALLVASALAAVALAKPEVRVEAAPMLGAASPVGPGWVTIQVRLENPGAAPVSGTVELRSRPGWTSDNERHVTRVPFALEPRGRAALELPTHGFSGRPPELSVRVYDTENQEIANASIGEFRQVDPLLFDLSTPSRIAATVRGQGVVLARRSGGS